MAIHRAAHLAAESTINGGATLLVTFTNSLTSYLEHIAGGGVPGVDIRTYHRFSRGYLSSRGKFAGYNIVAERASRRWYLRKAIEESRGDDKSEFFDRPIDFFLDELDWIAGHGLKNLDDYMSAQRIGRSVPLSAGNREKFWGIRKRYREIRAESGQRFDWWELPTAVREELAVDEGERIYRHVVIDEAQDLPPEAIRSLVDLVRIDGSVTLFADYAQQVYGHRTSYSSCNLNIKKIEQFADNYRNTREIALLAIAMSTMPQFTDSTDLVVPTAPVVAGAKPTLFWAEDSAKELAAVQARAAELGKTERVAVLAATWSDARGALGHLPNVRSLNETSRWAGAPGIYTGTYHSAKGLEFDAVILPFCGADTIPGPDAIKAFGEAEATARAARLVYVGVTRAKSELLVTYTGKLTEVLPPVTSGLWLEASSPK